MGTKDEAEAINAAKRIKEKGPQEKKISGKIWAGVTAAYVKEAQFTPGVKACWFLTS